MIFQTEENLANGIFQQLLPVPLSDTGKSTHTQKRLQTFFQHKSSPMKIL